VSAASKSDITLDFALLAPVEAEPPYYTAYVESRGNENDLKKLAHYIEDELLHSYHYKYCRDLGQLGPARVVRVKHGWQKFEETLVGYGQRSGNIKPVHLDSRTVWASIYQNTIKTGDSHGIDA